MFRVSTVAFTARLRIAADESLLESYVVAAAPYGGNGSGNDGEFGGWKGRHGRNGQFVSVLLVRVPPAIRSNR
jgi:hypothetical protein